MNKIYSKSPIKEAICQFKFHNKKEWDWTIPGIIYQKIKRNYPVKRQLTAFGFNFPLQKEDVESTEYLPLLKKPEGMRFLNEEKNRLIQIQEKTLSIFMQHPYSSWEDFKKQIMNALAIYDKELNPEGIVRIGLRYINHFDFLPERFEVEKYFNYYPAFPNSTQATMGELLVRSTIPIPNIEKQEGFMHLLLYLNKIEGQSINNILDLDMVYLQNEENLIMVKNASDYIEKAHSYIKEKFESCITDELRSIIKQMED